MARKTPKLNKRTGLYGRGGGRRAGTPTRVGSVLRGIGDAAKSLVGATKAGKRRRAQRKADRAENRGIRDTKKDLKEQLRDKGMSRGNARRTARKYAPEIYEAKNTPPPPPPTDKGSGNAGASVGGELPGLSNNEKVTPIQESKVGPQSPGDIATKNNMGTQGQFRGMNIAEMREGGRFDMNNPDYVGSYAQDVHGGKMKVGEFSQSVDINKKSGKAYARKVYSQRFSGNKKAKLDAIKAGKATFTWTDPHTGETRTMNTKKTKK